MVNRRGVGKRHTNCDSKFCIKQASPKRTVKKHDEIIWRKNRKYICSVPLSHWENVLKNRVKEKRKVVKNIQNEIKSIERDCVQSYGGSFESGLTQPHIPRESLITPVSRYPGAHHPNPELNICLSRTIPLWEDAMNHTRQEMKLTDDLNRYNNNKFLAAIDEVDLPMVGKKKLKVMVNPKTRRLSRPSVELAQHKLRIFNETYQTIPLCRDKLDDDS